MLNICNVYYLCHYRCSKFQKKKIKVKILILRARAIYRSRETADFRDASLDKTQITKGVRYPCGHCFFSAPTSGKLFVSFFKIQGVKIKYRVFWKIFQYSRPGNLSKGALIPYTAAIPSGSLNVYAPNFSLGPTNRLQIGQWQISRKSYSIERKTPRSD